jgi:hypothetical protein
LLVGAKKLKKKRVLELTKRVTRIPMRVEWGIAVGYFEILN